VGLRTGAETGFGTRDNDRHILNETGGAVERLATLLASSPWVVAGDTPSKQVLHLRKSKKYDIPTEFALEYRGADRVVELL
jgi:hypothetical protein